MFFTRRPPALPARDFPLVLRSEWRIDRNPRIGRMNALEGRTGPATARSNPMIEKAKLRRKALTVADIQRVEDFGLQRVPQDVADEAILLRFLRDSRAIAAE